MGLEGIVSKRAAAAYAPGNLGVWVKVKCLHREEFVVVGWTDPEGSRPWLGALLLAYYDPDGKLSMPAAPVRASSRRSWSGCGEGCNRSPSPRCRSRGCRRGDSRFGSPLVLSRVHWARPELGAEVQIPHLHRRQSAASGGL